MKPHDPARRAPGGDASIWRKNVRRLRKRLRRGVSGERQKRLLWLMVHS